MRSGVCDGFRGAPRFPRNRCAVPGVHWDLKRGLLEDDSSRGLTMATTPTRSCKDRTVPEGPIPVIFG